MTEFSDLQKVSNRQDYIFVKSQDLAWIVAIEKELAKGKSPEQIRDWWGNKYQREAMAIRIYHAAQHIQSGGGDE